MAGKLSGKLWRKAQLFFLGFLLKSQMDKFFYYRFSPSLLMAIIAPLSVILILVLLVSKNPKDYLVLISAIALLIGVLFTQAVKLYSEMRDRAFSLLMANRENDEYREASKTVEIFLMNEVGLMQDALLKLYRSKEKEDIELRRAIRHIGNFFEEMAIAIKYGEVNERLLEEFYIGMFVRFYDRTKNLLPVLRNDPPLKGSPFGQQRQPEVFCNLDFLYRRWKPKYEALVSDLSSSASKTDSTESPN